MAPPVAAQFGRVVDLEDLSLPAESYYNGSDEAGGFISRGAFFNNVYDQTFGVWTGWAYSNVTDVHTPGFGNQYSAYRLPTGGGDNSANYAVAFNFDVGDAVVQLPRNRKPRSVRITNTTYTALSMRDGDAFAKKFGGPSGNDPDFFLLTIYGLDRHGAVTGSVELYLADYRFAENSQDYIIDTWTSVNLTPLGDAFKLVFQLTSSDVDPVFGMNTPAYFALDNLVTRPMTP
jgi:hypothetical protein